MAEETAQQIIDRINARIQEGQRYGSYGEGGIQWGMEDLKNVENRFRSGELSSGDYSKILTGVSPGLKNLVDTLARGGQKSANAAWAAGGQDVYRLDKDFGILKSAQEILGRDIKPQDIDAIRPWFEGGDTEGRAYLTQLKEQEARTPTALRKKAGEYSGQVGNVFNDLLKRGATQQEVEHFGSMLASGDISEYDLRSFVQQLPEYRTAEDKSFREGLAGELGGYDQEAFGKAKEDVISRYARAGIQNSPALDFALTSLMGDIAKERGRYLSGLSAEQYGGNKAAAREDYGATLNRFLSDRGYERDLRQNKMQDYLTRGREVGDYNRQYQDYMSMLGSIPRQRQGGAGGAIGSLAGAGIGAFLGRGNPYAIQAGSSVGGAGGGLIDYWN